MSEERSQACGALRSKKGISVLLMQVGSHDDGPGLFVSIAPGFPCTRSWLIATEGGSGQGWGGVMYGREICTGASRNVNKSLTSFPSGHSNAAMGSAVFVSLWLNAKLKIFADSRARFWKLFLFL